MTHPRFGEPIGTIEPGYSLQPSDEAKQRITYAQQTLRGIIRDVMASSGGKPIFLYRPDEPSFLPREDVYRIPPINDPQEACSLGTEVLRQYNNRQSPESSDPQPSLTHLPKGEAAVFIPFPVKD